jgi:hypothetical protein
MNQLDSNTAPTSIPQRTWPLWLLFAASLSPLALIGLHWNVMACCSGVFVVAIWLAIGVKYYNHRGFVDPFDLLALLSCTMSIIAIGIAIYRWIA